jgi:predicted nucleotidyltransferase component of viral defense system
MENLDYKLLYELQDRVLEIVFNTEREFYLTGGTCLSRFYFEKRYSDDLDFFTNQSPRYYFAYKNIFSELSKIFQVSHEVEAKEFHRIKIEKTLIVDFVNDSSLRYKDPIFLPNKMIIDNIENILSNKLTAIMGRDNPKDIFDVYLICSFYNFDWNIIIETAQKKLLFNIDDLIVRLKTFPYSLLGNVKIKDPNFLSNFDVHYMNIIEEIKNKSEHIAISDPNSHE